jgi:RNA polymerase sigma-70 factor (ECF subfamily)
MNPSSAISQSQEQGWILRARQGDTEAFRSLVDACERRLLYFILRFLPDAHQALDVLQEVWLTVFRRLPGLRAPEAFSTWLYQITHDKVVSLVRRQRRERGVYEDLGNGRVAEAEDQQDFSREDAEAVHRALGLLSVEHREVLTLRFLEDMRLEEIAEALRCSLGTVKSRLHYARRALRHEMEKLTHE